MLVISATWEVEIGRFEASISKASKTPPLQISRVWWQKLEALSKK
jgi:hypothetical protein